MKSSQVCPEAALSHFDSPARAAGVLQRVCPGGPRVTLASSTLLPLSANSCRNLQASVGKKKKGFKLVVRRLRRTFSCRWAAFAAIAILPLIMPQIATATFFLVLLHLNVCASSKVM